MRMMNKTVREMAASLGAGTNTIIADLKSIDLALRKSLEPMQATAMLNERLSNLETLRDMALEGVEDGDGNKRIGYLNTIAKLEGMIVKLLQDAGVLPKRTSKHELAGQDGAPLMSPMTQAPIIRVVFEENADTKARMALAGGGAETERTVSANWR
jgi:hypothetical protein